MSERLALPPISDEDLAAARALYADQVAECAHCGGWSKPDPRSSPVRYPSTICSNEARDTWFVQCFSCFACTSSTFTALDALERWNRRVGDAATMKTREQVQAHLDELMKSGDCPSGDGVYLRALEWVLAGAATPRRPELLPLVDLEEIARRCRVLLTLDQEAFAIAVQRAVLARNRRPLS